MSRVITFYSYKGGTGRSMALANVAWILASNGKRVLAIDWDLEAPGLHRYFQPFLTDKELSGQESQGVIDMTLDFAVRAATPPESGQALSEKWYEPHADFSKWRQRLRWTSGEMLKLGGNEKGEIDFVPAGRQGPDYARRVNHFDWRSFYEKLGGGAFFDEARNKFAAYDYVLIDSRTGVSDTSGICTVHMPDTLVVCFTLNHQSIKGALAVALSVREQRPKMRIFPVPMRIDASETELLNRMKSYAASVFAPLLGQAIDAEDYWYKMEVPYAARYAYAEKLALFEERGSITASIVPAMERLTAYVTADEVREAGPLPEGERARALAEFEGSQEAASSTRILKLPSSNISPREKYDVFISYRSEYKPWVETLARNLERQGLTVWLDDWRKRPGDLITETLDKAMMDSRAGVLVVTPEAVASGWVQEEYASMLARERKGGFRLIPVILRETEGFPFLRNRVWIDFTAPAAKASSSSSRACSGSSTISA